MAFVLSLWSLELKTTPASAAPSMWLAGVDGVAGIGTEPFRSRANSLPGANRPIGPWPIRSLALSLPGAKWPSPFAPGNENSC